MTRSVQMNVRTDTDELTMWREWAGRHKISMAELVRRAITAYIDPLPPARTTVVPQARTTPITAGGRIATADRVSAGPGRSRPVPNGISHDGGKTCVHGLSMQDTCLPCRRP